MGALNSETPVVASNGANTTDFFLKMSLELEYNVTLPNGLSYTQPAGLFINNEYIKSKSGKTIDSINPSTNEVNGHVYAADVEDVDYAVKCARAAFKLWKKVSGEERSELLFKFADLFEKDQEIISAIEAWDSGKPLESNARLDFADSIKCFRYFAGWADKIHGRVIQNLPKKLAYTVHEPHGVCGQIIPWNYPVAMAAWKLAPALAAGNCVVLKTSEITPLSMLYVAQLFERAGFPAGVVNIISGYGSDCGKALSEHMDVDKVAFTGSTAVGKMIQKAAATNLKAVTLECGGKSPLIVRADAEIDQAVKWGAIGVMYNQGQVCTSTSRIYVHSDIYDEYVTEFKKHVEESWQQGDVFDEETQVGPQVSEAHYKKILEYIEIGKKEGARVVSGAEPNEEGHMGKGYFIKPTIFADVKPEMRIIREEIFGPVVSIAKFSSDEEVLALANDSEYGLGAALFTRDIEIAHNMASDIEAGMVWINSSNDSDNHIPFGGVKMSGVGRELGEYGLTTYTQAKAIHVNLGTRL